MLEALKALDLSIFLYLNSFHAEWINPVMVVLSGQVIWIPFLALILWHSMKTLGKKPTLLFAVFLVLVVISSDVTSSYIIKNIFNRLRPCREQELLPFIYQFGQKCGGKFGFVSSHAANTFGIMSFSFLTLRLRGLYLLLFLLPLLVSYSRIYLGVHYLGDILGGALIGICWSCILSWCWNNMSSKEQV